MSRIYTRADYEGVVDDNYQRKVDHRLRAEIADANFNTLKNRPIVVAGCGYGYLVEYLINQGFRNAWGFDASVWATTEGALDTSVPDRILLADMLSPADMAHVRQTAGQPWLIITEDVLPCMSSELEARAALANLRSILHNNGHMAHIVSPRREGQSRADGAVVLRPSDPEEEDVIVQMPGFLWLTPEEWRGIIGPGERIFLTHDLSEVP